MDDWIREIGAVDHFPVHPSLYDADIAPSHHPHQQPEQPEQDEQEIEVENQDDEKNDATQRVIDEISLIRHHVMELHEALGNVGVDPEIRRSAGHFFDSLVPLLEKRSITRTDPEYTQKMETDGEFKRLSEEEDLFFAYFDDSLSEKEALEEMKKGDPIDEN